MNEFWSYDDFDRYEQMHVPEGVSRAAGDPQKPEQFGVVRIVKLKGMDDDGDSMIVVLPLDITVSVSNRDTASDKINEIARLAREAAYLRQVLNATRNLRLENNLARMREIERMAITEKLTGCEQPFTSFLAAQQERLAAEAQGVERGYRDVLVRLIERVRRLGELGMFHMDTSAGYFDAFSLSNYEELLRVLGERR